MSTTTTLAVLYERVAEALALPRLPIKITATGGDIGYVTASSLIYRSSDMNAYDGRWVYVLSAGSAAPEDESTQVEVGGLSASDGSLTVTPVLTAAMASGDTFLLLPAGLHIANFLEAINSVQRTLYIPRLLPLTLASGGDMEGNITDFTDVGAPSTKEFVATAAHTLLRNAMHLAGGDGVGKTTANIDVSDTESLFVSVPIKVVSGECDVSLYNVTASENIADPTVVTSTGYAEVRKQFSIPSDCKRVAVRTLGGAAGSEFYVGWISVLYQNRASYILPSALADASEVEAVLHLHSYSLASDSDTYLPLSEAYEPWPWYEYPRDWRGANSHRISILQSVTTPIFLGFRTPGATLSGLTDTTDAPEEVVVEGAVSFLAESLTNSVVAPDLKADYDRIRATASRRYAALLDSLDLLKPKSKTATRNQRVSVPWS
jgi:hypothetical protein